MVCSKFIEAMPPTACAFIALMSIPCAMSVPSGAAARPCPNCGITPATAARCAYISFGVQPPARFQSYSPSANSDVVRFACEIVISNPPIISSFVAICSSFQRRDSITPRVTAVGAGQAE